MITSRDLIDVCHLSQAETDKKLITPKNGVLILLLAVMSFMLLIIAVRGALLLPIDPTFPTVVAAFAAAILITSSLLAIRHTRWDKQNRIQFNSNLKDTAYDAANWLLNQLEEENILIPTQDLEPNISYQVKALLSLDQDSQYQLANEHDYKYVLIHNLESGSTTIANFDGRVKLLHDGNRYPDSLYLWATKMLNQPFRTFNYCPYHDKNYADDIIEIINESGSAYHWKISAWPSLKIDRGLVGIKDDIAYDTRCIKPEAILTHADGLFLRLDYELPQ